LAMLAKTVFFVVYHQPMAMFSEFVVYYQWVSDSINFWAGRSSYSRCFGPFRCICMLFLQQCLPPNAVLKMFLSSSIFV
jgi:hypothetical protein